MSEEYQRSYFQQSQQQKISTETDDSQFYTTIHTKFPYSRLDCSKLFRVPIKNNQPRYNINQCDQILQERLQTLEKYDFYVYRTKNGLDLRKQFSSFSSQIKTKNMRRKVKLEFYCKKCNKNFTSIVGLFEIKYTITVQNDKTTEIEFKPKIYTMECSTCGHACNGKIYKSQFRAVMKGFYLIIAQIIDGIEPPKHVDKRHKHDDVHDHIQSLCQACKKGVCFARKKKYGENRIVENTKEVQILTSQEQKYRT